MSAALVLMTQRAEARAGFTLPDAVSTLSYSGQFQVLAERTPRPAPVPDLVTNKELVWLDPMLLTVSAERIKQELWRELGTTGPWRGKIFLVLRHVTEPSQNVSLVVERFPDGWQYKITLPEIMERTAYVRTVVQVLLLELALRDAPVRSAEMPRWLVEGLTGELLATSSAEIVLAAPRASATGVRLASTFKDARRTNPLEHAHKLMRSQSPLTFEQLSWPTDDQLTTQHGEFYRCNAQLFVDELLRLPDGRKSLLAMLKELPQYYNWQFAFLHAFHPHFERPLDVEKWWALRTVQFTGRDLAQTWPLEESLAKLGQAIHTSIEVRSSATTPPQMAEVSLQTIIRDWDQARQTQALQGKLRELEQLRIRVVLEVALLIDSYRQVLGGYLDRVEKSESLVRYFPDRDSNTLAARTIRQLDTLDTRRVALARRAPPATQPDGTQASAGNP